MTDQSRPPAAVASILYTDASGLETLPDAVMEDARESGRWKDLVGPVAALMADPLLHPLWRWIACQVLCGWADPSGYEAVERSVADPEHAAWSHVAEDRFGRDQTFGELAEVVGDSREFAEERGTTQQRLSALRVLLRAADRVDLMHGTSTGIVSAFYTSDVQILAPEVRAAVQAVSSALHRDHSMDPVRLAGLLVVLSLVDEPEAVARARDLIDEWPTGNVLTWCTYLVSGGTSEESLLLAQKIAEVAATRRQAHIGAHLDRALEERRRCT